MYDERDHARSQLASTAFNPHGLADMAPPPPPSGPQVTGRDKVLLDMQKLVFEFYKQYNPDKLRKSVITVALQLWWDEGLIVLNHFLIEKYGRGLKCDRDFLDDFDRKGEDVTLVSKHELNVDAAHKHPMVKVFIKTNSANYFLQDKNLNARKFEDAKQRRMNLGNKPVTSLFNMKRSSASKQGQMNSTGEIEGSRRKRRTKKHHQG